MKKDKGTTWKPTTYIYSLKHGKNASRIASFEPIRERVREKIVLRTIIVRFQGIIEHQLERSTNTVNYNIMALVSHGFVKVPLDLPVFLALHAHF